MAGSCWTTFSSITPFTKEEFINLMNGVAKNAFVYSGDLLENGEIELTTYGWNFYRDEEFEKGITDEHYLNTFINAHTDKVRIHSEDYAWTETDDIYGAGRDPVIIEIEATLPCLAYDGKYKCNIFDNEGNCLLKYGCYLADKCEECDYHKKHSEYFPNYRKGRDSVVEAIVTWHHPKYTLFLEKQKDGSTINLRDNKPIVCPICGSNYKDIITDKGAYTLFFNCDHKVIRVHKDENGVVLSEDYRKGNALDKLKKNMDERYGGNYIIE